MWGTRSVMHVVARFVCLALVFELRADADSAGEEGALPAATMKPAREEGHIAGGGEWMHIQQSVIRNFSESLSSQPRDTSSAVQ